MAKPYHLFREAIEADPERLARVQEYKRAMRDADQLGELRGARGTVQEAAASTPDRPQSATLHLEHEEDLYLSTLRDYVAALGGRLELTAVFPDQTVQLVPGPRRQHQDTGPKEAEAPLPSSQA